MKSTLPAKYPKTPSWLFRPNSGKFVSRDVYIAWVFRKMMEDSRIQTASDNMTRFRYSSLFIHENGKVQTVADWRRFQIISEVLFWIMSEALIAGHRINLGKIGYLQPRKRIAKQATMMINWKETTKYCKENNLPICRTNMIFYNIDEYCQIAWNKNTAFGGCGKYLFVTADVSRYGTSIKDRFTKALKENQTLKHRYPVT